MATASLKSPKGNQFSLKYLATSGTDVAEPIAQYYVDSWKQVGINVELYEVACMSLTPSMIS